MHVDLCILRFSIAPITAVVIALGSLAASTSVAGESSAGDAALFDRLDANGDWLLSADEVAADHQRLFARLLRRADENGDHALTREEFLAGLVPSRPEKPIEVKQPANLPEADAVRYLLLTIDTDVNGVIEADEVREEMRGVFDALADRLDRNENGSLEPIELNRGGPLLARIAGRYVASRGIDAATELKKLEKAQGQSADRFDGRRPPFEMFADPRQARALFARLNGNGDGQLERDEVPEPFQPQLERFLSVADRNRDGRLSECEFLAGAERISRLLKRSR